MRRGYCPSALGAVICVVNQPIGAHGHGLAHRLPIELQGQSIKVKTLPKDSRMHQCTDSIPCYSHQAAECMLHYQCSHKRAMVLT